MVGIYFSGTGNTRHCISKFLYYYNNTKESDLYSIEDINCIKKIEENSDIVFAYPIYYSDLPIIVKNFLNDNKFIFKNKNIFIISTMGLFSGDGTACSARLFKMYGANVIGGLHLKMPDCIGDVKILKRSSERNKLIVKNAELKIKRTVMDMKKGKYIKDGLTFFHHIAGLLGQRLWFYNKTLQLRNKLKINYNNCISCNKCSVCCPVKNIKMIDNKPIPQGKCICCYRCISNCPKRVITLIGNKVYEQNNIQDYIQ
ncbi:MAG: iron-sulfur protein [Clostridia bacterium]|jgi:ferredoxin|nr:iron-sulfur protein [Clostridia bacterium]